jgi:tRNA-uridine 2-sulfurtransferase
MTTSRPNSSPPHAVGLISGGLDSALAAALMLEQGVRVTALHYESPLSCHSEVRAVAGSLGIPLVVRAKGPDFLRLLREPRWGYGRNMNPCVDCRVYMLQSAAGELRALGADFLFTGEVVGQRPMSQLRGRLRLVEKHSGLEGRVLRPLSARLLPETEPERLGLVDRSRLLAISGRSRRVQMAEAKRLGLLGYGSPAGGCLLTDPGFSRRVRDWLDHEGAHEGGEEDLRLLSLGRHFRIGPDVKIVLGRNQAENGRLAGFAGERRWLVEPEGFPGPTALVCGPRSDAALERAMALINRHSRVTGPRPQVRVGAGESFRFHPLGPAADHSAPDVAL